MPQSGQIILPYLHPGEWTYINDNTGYTDYTSENTGVRFLNVFASDSGRDRVLLNFSNVNAWVKEYGLPNYRLYGQPPYNAYVSLSTGLATSWSMRVTAADASIANMILVCYYKKEDGKLKLKFNCYSKTDLRNEDDLDAYMNTLEQSTPDEDGYLALPIMKFWMRGRGTYGNNYRIRISADKNTNKENGYMNYLIELLSTKDGFSMVENYSVCFYIDAIDPNTTITRYVNDIMDDENGKGSPTFNCQLVYDNVAKIFDVYKEVYATNGYVPPVVKQVAKLPALEAPSATTHYVLVADAPATNSLSRTANPEEINTVWKYDPELGIFEADPDYPKMVPIADELFTNFTTINTWVDSTTGKTYDFIKSENEGVISLNIVQNQTYSEGFESCATLGDVDATKSTNKLYQTSESSEVTNPDFVPPTEDPEPVTPTDPEESKDPDEDTEESGGDLGEESGPDTGTDEMEPVTRAARNNEDNRPTVNLAAGFYHWNGTSWDPVDASTIFVTNYAPSPLDTPITVNNCIWKVSDGYKIVTVVDGAPAVATIADVKEVTELPSTDVYEENVVYELTASDGSKPVGSQWIYNDTAQDYIAYVEEIPENPDPLLLTMETFDIFGYNRYTQADDEFITFDGGKEAIQVMDLEGAPFDAGSDGMLGEGHAESEREEALETAYLAAFGGEYDKTILSARRAPIDIILDANYSFNVKTAITALTLNRNDCVCHLDCGLITNVDDLFTYGNQLNNFANYAISKDAHMFKTVDAITGKIIPVTITLMLAQMYPNHYYNYGNHVPMAGETYGTLSGYQENSIKPVIDADDHDIKESLYNDYHINYIEALDETTYIRGTQSTSQEEFSDLSEENNVLVLFEIKRTIERLAASNRYKWADTDNLRLFKEDCEEVFSSYIGTKCRDLTIDCSMNEYEETRYIVHIYLSVVFRTFQKRAIIEIDINPRA